MFKYVLSLTFAVGFATAATITTSATCDDIIVTGTLSARCNDGRVMADAFLGASIDPSPSFHVLVEADPSVNFAHGSASAHFSDDYVFTVTGGTGSGFFMPCFLASVDFSGGVAGVGMSFGGVSFSQFGAGAGNSCFVSPQQRPFTFDVPQIVHVSIDGSAGSVGQRRGAGREDLTEIQFFDAAGHQLSNVTFTLVPSIPEPSVLSLVSVGVMFLVAVRIVAGRCKRVSRV